MLKSMLKILLPQLPIFGKKARDVVSEARSGILTWITETEAGLRKLQTREKKMQVKIDKIQEASNKLVDTVQKKVNIKVDDWQKDMHQTAEAADELREFLTRLKTIAGE